MKNKIVIDVTKHRWITIQKRKSMVRKPCNYSRCFNGCTYFNLIRPENKAIEIGQTYYEIKTKTPYGSHDNVKVCSLECLKADINSRIKGILEVLNEMKDFYEILEKMRKLETGQ